MSRAYYNEIDPEAAAWLRELIKAGHIAPGDVDERSIEDVTPAELMGYTQCHFFAGIGVWSYALRSAGWPDDRPVWTGSCPCQPFSSAGKGAGFTDERHLWPAFHWLIQQCRPVTVFGEQVASKDGRAWLDLVSADVESEGYSIGAVSTVACGFGAPHKRQRLFFVAESLSARWPKGRSESGNGSASGSGGAGELADLHINGRDQGRPRIAEAGNDGAVRDSAAGELGDPGSERLPIRERKEVRGTGRRKEGRTTQQPGETPDRPGPTNGHWGVADWLFCRDGRWRPVEPGTFPLASRTTEGVVPDCDLGMEEVESTKEARVMRLRGYGNAIVAQQAKAFIEAYIASR